jgi:hypothetical protein
LGDAPPLAPVLSYCCYVCRGGAFALRSAPFTEREREKVMGMLRSVGSKVAWVGRTASMVFGLALVLALMFGVASMALGANGGNFILGQNNVATAITRLAGTAGVDGPMLQLINNNEGTNDTALALNVQAGEAPMRVNSTRKVANLNADRIDDREASLGCTPNAGQLR